jgi:hypothetical protein
VALIQAWRGQDDEGMRVLLAHCDRMMVLTVALALLGQAADEHGAGYRELLAWGACTVDKALGEP